MKKYQKANLGFQRITDENLLTLADTVIRAMTDNESFIDPNPSLEDVESTKEDFTEKLANARRKGSPYDTAIKNEVREKLEKILSQLAFYVNTTADGNIAVLLSSGFHISRYRSTILSPRKIEIVRLTDGRNSGQMVLSFERMERTRLYEYRVSDKKDEEGEIVWGEQIYITTTSQNNIIQPVTPGKLYYVSIRSINSRGAGDWSEPRSWMAR